MSNFVSKSYSDYCEACREILDQKSYDQINSLLDCDVNVVVDIILNEWLLSNHCDMNLGVDGYVMDSSDRAAACQFTVDELKSDYEYLFDELVSEYDDESLADYITDLTQDEIDSLIKEVI